jgi:hypothetical protein
MRWVNALRLVSPSLPQRTTTLWPGVGVIQARPYVEQSGSAASELPIGMSFKNFLDHPLGGSEKLNLPLPFYDQAIGIGDDGGGWFRNYKRGVVAWVAWVIQDLLGVVSEMPLKQSGSPERQSSDEWRAHLRAWRETPGFPHKANLREVT